MKLMALSLALMAAAPAFAADPVLGNWTTQPDDNGHFGLVTIAPCGEAICGKLVRAYDGKGQPIASDAVGRQIIWDMHPAGNGKYADGKVWAPDRDKTYNSKMTLAGDRLDVYGCILGFCRSQSWTRAR